MAIDFGRLQRTDLGTRRLRGPGNTPTLRKDHLSPLCNAAEENLEILQAGGGDNHILFIEDDPARYANLDAKLSSIPENARKKTAPLQGTFEEGIAQLRKEASTFAPSANLRIHRPLR